MSEKKDLKRIEQEVARWEVETLQPTIENAPERAERFTSVSMTPVERLYTPADL